jgi:hypothetical protein
VEEVIVNTQTEEITVRHILPLDQKFPLCKGSNLTAACERGVARDGEVDRREISRQAIQTYLCASSHQIRG